MESHRWTSSAQQPQHGWIEVITGSMFSGKSEELIRRLRRAQIARQKVQIFKPLIDNRFSDDHIVSHSDMRIASQNVAQLATSCVEQVADDTEVVGIDEGQFFDPNLPAACNTLADRGKRVIVAGLDQDYLGRPFEPMPQLLAIAEYITKTLAICVVCGDPANHTQRLVASSDRVLVGATGLYEARCRHCFDPHARGGRADVAVPIRRRSVNRPWTCVTVRPVAARRRLPVAERAALASTTSASCGGAARRCSTWPAPQAAVLRRCSLAHRRRARPAGVRTRCVFIRTTRRSARR